jgi:hypothetical protein
MKYLIIFSLITLTSCNYDYELLNKKILKKEVININCKERCMIVTELNDTLYFDKCPEYDSILYVFDKKKM